MYYSLLQRTWMAGRKDFNGWPYAGQHKNGKRRGRVSETDRK